MAMFMMCFAVSLVSCNGCGNKPVAEDEPELNPAITELVVENVVSTDREYMFMNYGEGYRWFDEECDGTVTGISNVFQVVEEKDKGADTFVVLAAHTPDTTAYEVKHGFWVEDFPMNEEQIKVTFAQAFEKLNQVNYPKPHSKQCVLRKQVGPKACNPQYIFGNAHAQLYVDAVTGEVSNTNPAYGDIKLETPLGEWP